MMIRFVFILCLVLTIIPASAADAERWFAIGSEIRNEQGVIMVTTKAGKPREGIVQTRTQIKGNAPYMFHIQAKGKGRLLLKVEEFDTQGKFLAEQTSESIRLDPVWQPLSITLYTQPNTNQLDLFVLTEPKQAMSFHIRDITFKHE